MNSAAIKAFIDHEVQKLRDRPKPRAFDKEEYAERLQRLRRQMALEGVQLAIVSSPDAMCWLHGYQSRWYRAHSSTSQPPLQCTAVHVDHDDLIQFDDAAHRDLIPQTSIVEDLRLYEAEDLRSGLDFIMRELRSEGWLGGVAGLELWSSIPNRYVSEAFEAALIANGCTVRDSSLLVRAVRRIKSPAEIATIEEAARVCDAGLLALRDALRPGMTELEAWAALVSGMAAAGGEPAAIHEGVYAGTSHIGHAISSRRPLRSGDYVEADPCGVINRYHANIARHLVLGEPAAEALRIAELEGGAYEVLCSTAKAGTPVRDVSRALREYYQDAGVWNMRRWAGGYELGVSFPPDWVGEWYFTVDDESPDGVFETGMVTNYESMIAFVTTDTVVYEADGARTLSSLPFGILVAAG